jgi:hypothetical protein
MNPEIMNRNKIYPTAKALVTCTVIHIQTYRQTAFQIQLLLIKGKVKVQLSLQQPMEAKGLSDVEAPTFSRQSPHRWQ